MRQTFKSTAFAAGVWAFSIMAGLAETISDTAGYVTLTSTDPSGTSSFNTSLHWSENAAPHAGTNYLVQGGLTLRTPNSLMTDDAFAGDSLTLDNANMNMKHYTCSMTIKDLRLYSCRIAHGMGMGGANGTFSGLAGAISVYGTAEAPSTFSGSGSGGTRVLGLAATLSGAETNVIGIIRTPTEGDSSGQRFFTVVTGTNTSYRGRFTVTGFNINLAANGDCALGTGDLADGTSVVTLYNQGGFFGADGYAFTNTAYSISVTNSGTLGAYSVGTNNLGLLFGNGVRIAGTGTLYIDNRRGATAFDDVRIEGLTKIVVTEGTLRFYKNYNHPDLSIVVTNAVDPGSIAGECENLGAVTLNGNSYVSPGVGTGSLGTLGMKSLTVNGSSYFITSIQTNGAGVATSDFIRVKGNLSKGPGVGKIPFQLDNYLVNVENPVVVRLLSAANLGTDITADDFSICTTLDYASNILSGTFSVETENGTNYLVFTRTSRPIVQLAGSDADAPTSFDHDGKWSNAKAPSNSYDYLVPYGKLLRARVGATFAGHSLSIISVGDFAINGVIATVPDLRLYSGSIISTRNSGDQNTLCGTGTVYATSDNPVNFMIEQTDNKYRALNLKMALKGSGDIRFRCYAVTPTVVATFTGGYFLISGDNTEFTGGINLFQPAITVDFTNETAMGGPAPAFREDRLRFTSNAVLRCSSSYTLSDSTRGITLEASAVSSWDGGSFEVLTNQTLTVQNIITGGGSLRKLGTGTLVLDAVNTYSNYTRIKAGTLTVRNLQALGEGHVECSTNGILRIETAEGVRLSATNPLITSDGAQGLKVELSAFEVDPGDRASVDANLFLIPGATEFDTSKITLVNSKLGKKFSTIEIKTKATDAGLLVYARAKADGTCIQLLP